MKVALVHDYLKEIGGAERVLMTLKDMWPDAPVYTAYKFPEYWGEFRPVLEKWDIRESWGKYLPFLPQWIAYYTVISPLFFESWDLSGYDLVIISATGGYLPNGVKVGPNTKVVTYCHTPPRFLYGYPVATTERYKWYWRIQSEIANHILRIVDFKLAQKPNLFIANSEEVQKRIKKFYRRDSVVVYPPVQVTKLPSDQVTKKNYFVMVTRIVRSKNIELAVEAANQYGFKLKIAGRPIGLSGAKIVKMIGGNAEYVGEVSDQEKAELLASAQGVLCLEEYADFGIVAIEPQMYGTPVIVYKSGGYVESVKDGETGVLIDTLSVEAVYAGVQRVEKTKWNEQKIQAWAGKFGVEEFKAGIRQALQTVLQTDKF